MDPPGGAIIHLSSGTETGGTEAGAPGYGERERRANLITTEKANQREREREIAMCLPITMCKEKKGT